MHCRKILQNRYYPWKLCLYIADGLKHLLFGMKMGKMFLNEHALFILLSYTTFIRHHTVRLTECVLSYCL